MSRKYGNKLTKSEIIEKVKNKDGFYMNTDGIRYSLDGKGMAEYLYKIGFEIVKHYDTGYNGLVITKEGIKVSTNGYCSIIK